MDCSAIQSKLSALPTEGFGGVLAKSIQLGIGFPVIAIGALALTVAAFIPEPAALEPTWDRTKIYDEPVKEELVRRL
jgi:hypothetical protein